MNSAEIAVSAALATPVIHTTVAVKSAAISYVAPKSLTGPQLLSKMVSLATPVAGGAVGVSCTTRLNAEDDRAGQAAPWDPQFQIQLTTDTCKRVGRVILHRHGLSAYNSYGLHALIHEAAHVAQWREGTTTFDPADSSRWWEHDAECRTLKDYGTALYTLHYKPLQIVQEVKYLRTAIMQEDAPYGGVC